MIKRWHLALVVVGLLMAWGSSGCKKSSGTAGSLLQVVPRQNHGVFMLQRIGDVPKQLNALLTQYEGKKGQFRTFIQGTQGRFGLNPMALESLKASGLNPKGAMVASRFRHKGHKHGMLALSISSAAAFEKWLKNNLRTRLVAKNFVASTGSKIITAYRIDRSKKTRELLAYVVRKSDAVLVWRFTSSVGTTRFNAEALASLLAQKASNSLQTDKAFHKALAQLGKASQALMYVPPNAEKVDAKTAKARTAMMKKRLNVMKRRFPLLGRLPESQLQALAKANPLEGVISALSFGNDGVQLRSHVPIPKMVMAPVRSAVPSGGSAKELLKALHKDAIITIKGGVEPAMLPVFLQQAASGMKRDPAKIHALLKQFTGLSLKKDIIPAATGHVMLTFYKIDVKKIVGATRGNVNGLFQAFDLALVAQAKDPKKMQSVLDILQKSFKNGAHTVKSVKQKEGRELYSIVAWPGTNAYWTSYKNYFIYALSEASIKRSIQAIKDPKSRVYPDTSKAGILAQNNSSALSIDVGGLRGLVADLPFMVKLFVSNAIANYNLDKIHAINLSYQPGQAHAILQAGIKLKTK